MAMQKAVHDCATGEVKLVDMEPAEEAKLQAMWAEPAPVKPRDRVAEMEARLAALEAKSVTPKG